MTNPSVAIISATRIEAEPIICALGLIAAAKAPIPVFRGNGLVLAISGIGKVNSAIAVSHCCTVYVPRWVLNIGAAGAMDGRFRLGEILHITKVLEPDRLHFRTGNPCLHIPSVLPGFKEAILATQDRPVLARSDREAIARIAGLADMEGAAIVMTARRFKTPALLFKLVSDTPEDYDTSRIVEHIRLYEDVFCDFVLASVLPRLKPAGEDLA